MKVFNLTDKPIEYRGRSIPSSGGSLEYADLSFIPNRDMRLVEKRVLSFGDLPSWWLSLRAEQSKKPAPKKIVNIVEKIVVKDEVKPEKPFRR
jgi:hypothetical protein